MPPWRHFQPLFDEEGDALTWIDVVGFVLGLVSAFFTVLVFPLAAFLAELPVRAIRAVFSSARWVEAAPGGSRQSPMTWRTDASHASAVADQVARQLELGYDRIEPHNAVFEGFVDS